MPVPDKRLDQLAEVISSQEIVPAVVEFIDIAGLVKGAAQGEGLGNQFLAHIRSCDAIAEVIRVFTDKNVLHVEGSINPSSDIETIKTELILADLETTKRRLEKLTKELKGNPKTREIIEVVEKVEAGLDKNISVRELNLSEKEKLTIRDLNLLTAKPRLYIVNSNEEQLKIFSLATIRLKEEESVIISAKTEEELSELPDKDKKEYLKELGQDEPGLNTLVKKSLNLLGLLTFFTTNENQIRAWTIKKGSTALQAAGAIHTDFEKGFIKAEIVNYKDLIELGGWNGARTGGKARLEGKEYIVQEGDTMLFKFNA